MADEKREAVVSRAGNGERARWTSLNDQQLLAQCEVDTYRASGPGGQKRNKTSSAVRTRHLPSGLIVIAEESRSQAENRARALKRLRQALYLKIRQELPGGSDLLAGRDGAPSLRNGDGRLDMGRKDSRFWPAAGVVLDVLDVSQGRVAEAAAALGISTGNLISFLEIEPKVWEEANHLRARFGHKTLRSS